MVKVTDLVKVFHDGRAAVTACESVSFDVPTGRFFTLLGPSGCGKTTTLRSIAGLERPDDGQIELDGTVVYSSQCRVFVPPVTPPVLPGADGGSPKAGHRAELRPHLQQARTYCAIGNSLFLATSGATATSPLAFEWRGPDADTLRKVEHAVLAELRSASLP